VEIWSHVKYGPKKVLACCDSFSHYKGVVCIIRGSMITNNVGIVNEMCIYDVAIIGGGVIGCNIARYLSKYNLKICLIEKESDVACRTSSANSGIVHAGYDAVPGTLKAKFNVRGNEMMDEISHDLDVPFKRIGSLVIAFDEKDMEILKELYERGISNGVPDMQILDGNQVREKEPAVNSKVIGALYAPTAGIICPYELTIGAAEIAVQNGVELMLDSEVVAIKVVHIDVKNIENTSGSVDGINIGKVYEIELKGSQTKIYSGYIVNAAGVYSDKIAAMVGDTSFTVTPRKGEYLLMDKNQGKIVNSVIFQTPSQMGKGILVSPTVDGNLLLGPTAKNIEDKEDISTDRTGLSQVIQGALRSVPDVDLSKVITSFSGLRAVSSTGDFIIGESKAARGFINVAGIESPGLTAAPAIAEYVAQLLEKAGLILVLKDNYMKVRKPFKRFRNLQENELRELIKKNPLYGNIICRCEKVSAAEIVEAIRRPAGARTLDGVKRRTRAGMGRCQGGFCTPRIMHILSQELGIPMEKVTKSGGDSWMILNR